MQSLLINFETATHNVDATSALFPDTPRSTHIISAPISSPLSDIASSLRQPLLDTMAPPPTAVMIDTSDDFDFSPAPAAPSPAERTLLLCPPSLASNPALLESHLSHLNRTTTDVQMLDRLSLGLVSLPPSTYTSVILLPGSSTPLTPAILAQINTTMKPGARWTSDSPGWASEKLPFLIAGFMVEGEVVTKPDFGGQKTVALKPRAKKTDGEGKGVVVPVEAPREKRAAVGFDFGDDLDDEEFIDEDELMADESLATTAQIREFSRSCLGHVEGVRARGEQPRRRSAAWLKPRLQPFEHLFNKTLSS